MSTKLPNRDLRKADRLVLANPSRHTITSHPLREDPKAAVIFARFEEKYETIPETSCWWWTGSSLKSGYGIQRVGKTWLAHRLSYLIHTGVNPGGMSVMHSCDNPSCVNPDHLSLGTAKDNADDKVRKGRSLKGESHPGSKLTDEQVKEIRMSTDSYPELSRRYGVTTSNICIIRSKKTWKDA